MRTVELHGRLAKKFGRKFEFEIEHAGEACAALISQLPGFEEELRKGFYKLVRVGPQGEQLTGQDMIALQFGQVHTLQIIPVAGGNKSGIFGVIAGVFLVGAAFLLTGGALSATALTLFGSTITGTQLAFVGGLLAFSGIAGMLSPEMEQPTEDQNEKQSAIISSPTNRGQQGNAIPWAFGKRFFMGSLVISDAIVVEDWD